MLPPSATLTGAWQAGGITAPNSSATAVISFPVKLPAALAPANVHHPGKPNFATNCTGTAANPTAAAGHFCIYTGAFSNADYLYNVFGGVVEGVIKVSAATGNGTDRTGARLLITGTAGASAGTPGSGVGTWAVTAAP